MKQHVARIAAACFYHIRCMRQIRCRVGQEVTQQLVLALIMSRLDYCNSVLAGLSMSTLEPLHRVHNAAARLVFGLGRFDHVTPNLIQLHWLPVSHRTKFKLLTRVGRRKHKFQLIRNVAPMCPHRCALMGGHIGANR